MNPAPLERALRCASAVRHLGLRQAWRNLVHRARAGAFAPRRYLRRSDSDLRFAGRAATTFGAAPATGAFEEGAFTTLGRTRCLGWPPRWDPPEPEHWLYHLHYHDWLAPLAPAERAAVVRDWIARNPPAARSAAWRPYPLSLRLRNWTRFFFLESGAGATPRELLPSLEAQGNCLADTAEFHLRGNHLFEDGLTLLFLAACFEGAASRRWRRKGDSILAGELDEQFLGDGGHAERSPLYHALLTAGLLDLLNVLPPENPWSARLRARLPALLRFAAALRHPDGGPALFNDCVLGLAAEPDRLLAYASALGVPVADPASASFPETGYHVFRRRDEAFLVDAGPVAPDYLPAHAHGDIFSFETSLGGRRLVVDGGTSTYEAGAERNWVRSTRAHNTVEIEDVDQCEFFGAFRMGRRGRPRDVRVELGESGLQLSGWHDGYRRLGGRPLHRRELRYLQGGVVLVWDRVDATRPVKIVSRVRFAPGTQLERSAAESLVVKFHDRSLRLIAFGAALEIESGFYAPRFGERLACPVAALHARTPEFGFALAPMETPAAIDAAGASVAGVPVARWGFR